MNEFRFAEPAWVHGLWAVLAFVALLFWLDRRGSGAIDRLVSRVLQDRLVKRSSGVRRRLRILFLGLCTACLVIALMRPQLGVRHVAAPRVGAEIMVALDVSKSMLAEDVAPNRLDRAKAEIVDLLPYLKGDQVGLIAFAGRATVLAPMTPDFSFLRMVLDGTGPHSVSRGGTRLEEPIRKAIQGFGPAQDASRVILLITDGEDQGSFPRDAATEAAEAGIVIIAIGFGDERGSEIVITDPRTGAREALRDSDGELVRSRLDGELLRDLALATQGAYVPAGTGVLDLESIYRQHIERLMVGQLDPRGQTVRDEGYQWMVLLALVLLISSVAVSSGTQAASWGGALLFMILTAPAPPVHAQEASEAKSSEEAAELVQDVEADVPSAPPEPEDPREIYNRGVSALESEAFDEALREFEAARRAAGSDGELRFRSAYDLGLAHVGRATGLLAESPEEALRTFYTAADWFRDAITQRPDHEDSRVNLEVVLRRALVLADRIAQQNEKGVDAELEALAASERALVGELAALHDRVSKEPEVATEARRREFSARATDQRALLSEGDRLAGAIAREREAIAARSEEERTPEVQMRGAQLEGVLHYLHRAREKMGQTRRQLRQRQSERAYRRASASLAELKRALDQLREPAAILDELIREVTEIGGATAALAMSGRELPAAASAPHLPAWLTAESLHDEQESAAQRTQEFDQKLLAGLEQQSAASNPEQAALLEAVRVAEPLVAAAAAGLVQATAELGSGAPEAALPHQRDALLALSDARERFLDLRGLIEVTYADEQRIAEVLGTEVEAAARKEFQPALRELQERNIVRGERLSKKIAEAAQAPPQPGPDGSPPDPEAEEIERQRLDLAAQLLISALGNMDGVKQALAPDGAAKWSEAVQSAGSAVEHLESLRRIFFSIVEELRDTHRQQVDLTDATQDAAALSDPAAQNTNARVGPLMPRQQSLAERAAAIASALEEQSNQSGGTLDGEADGAETSRRLRQAGEHVLFAEDEMKAVVAGLDVEAPEFGPIQERQAAAVAELEAALALLVPPEDREGEDESDSEDSSEDESGGEGEQEQEQASEQPQEAADPAQLLQSVRDREAQRRRERDQKGRPGYETVERDW